MAQDIFGRISGTVTDSQGAVVPNANVTISDEQTKIARTVQTDGRGFYVADDIAAGTYTVSVEQQGFKTTKKVGNVLNAGGRLTVDLQLEVGTTSTAIEVVAQGEAINTVSGEISHTVDSSQVQQLALNQRNYAQLVSLIPGAVLTEFNQQNLTTNMATTGSSVNGRRADGNNFAVDGGFNLDSGSNASQLNNVGIDFIQEVAIKASNFSAEYGRNSGASVNVVTRRGGDSYHGGAFEFIRNNITDAIPPNNKIFIPAGTSTKSLENILRFNDFGWNFGGPIVHKKLFFFAGEEWKRIRTLAASQKLTIPTTAELSGDFRDLVGKTLVQPTNRPTGCTVTNNVLSPQCITLDGKAIAAVYARMAQVASTFTNTPTNQNALFQPNNPSNWREDIVRIDYQLSNAHSIYGRYIHDELNLIDAFGTFVPANTLPTSPTNRLRPGYGIQVADVWIINSHLVNEAKFNVSWNKQRIPPTGDLWKRSTYGFQFTPPLGFGGRFPDGLPHTSFSGIGAAFPTAAPTQFTGPFFSLLAPTTDISPQDNLTWTLGSHTLKFGVMYARNRKDQNSRPDSYNGRINFQAGTAAVSTGVPFADALMGNFQSFSQQSADPIGHFRFHDIEGYVQDSWKVTRNLSLELGVRWQNIAPTYTQGNNMTNFDPALYVPGVRLIAGSGNTYTQPDPTSPFLFQGNVIDGLVRAGNGVPSDQLVRVPGATSPFVLAVPAGAPRGLYRVQNYFAPRFGFSWSPFKGDNTVVRGGFGMFYDKPEGNIIFGQPGVPPFLTSGTFNNANLSNITGGTGATPTIFNLSAVDPHFKNAYSMQYSFSLQHQMPFGILAELAYVGNQGRHEVRQPNINVPNFAVALANPTVATNRLRPFVGYTDITQFRSDSNSNYNALQAFASKRKGGLQLTVSYTWSRALGDTSGINDNPEPECALICPLPNGQVISWQRFDYGRLGFDRQHIFVVTYNYELPFFRHSGGIRNAVLGGWEIGGITRAQSGAPLTVTASQVIATGTGTGVLQFTRRANFDPSVPLYSGFTCPPRTKCWFNPAAFSVPAPNTIGNAPTQGIVGPGYYNWDISIRKRFNLPREGMNLLFQTDFFNAFNRANWANPGTNASGTPGTIGSANPARQLQFGLKFAF